jgi:hypothetical protein
VILFSFLLNLKRKFEIIAKLADKQLFRASWGTNAVIAGQRRNQKIGLEGAPSPLRLLRVLNSENRCWHRSSQRAVAGVERLKKFTRKSQTLDVRFQKERPACCKNKRN